MPTDYNSNAGEVVAAGLMLILRCSNPDCKQIVAQVHSMSMSVVRVIGCPVCQYGSQFENTPSGWNVRRLPKMTTQRR